MPRKYDCLVRFYASWFADLTNESKGFSFDEIGQILLKIADAQLRGNAEIIQELPITIKRGLQMATLEEQITRLIERSAKCKERGSIGGQVTAHRNKNVEQELAQSKENEYLLRRKLDEYETKERNERQRHTIWVRTELAKVLHIEIKDLPKAKTTWSDFQKVYEADTIKEKIDFPEWLIYSQLFSSKEVKQFYKDITI